MQITVHPETYMAIETLGSKLGEYRPNFPIQGYLNPHHEFLSSLPANQMLCLTVPGFLGGAGGREIEGWLWHADGLKLYEMAYFADGDILELGTFQGLSACLMAQAVLDSGRNAKVVTIDIGDYNWKRNVDEAGLTEAIEFRPGDAVSQIEQLSGAGSRFGFGFVDHSHRYAEVAKVCPLLPSVLQAGSFVQFHDYNDPRNGTHPDYGVWQAVDDSLPPAFQFSGIYGCSGLYRYTPGGQS